MNYLSSASMETQSQIYQFLRHDGLQEVRREKHSSKPHGVSMIACLSRGYIYNTEFNIISLSKYEKPKTLPSS